MSDKTSSSWHRCVQEKCEGISIQTDIHSKDGEKPEASTMIEVVGAQFSLYDRQRVTIPQTAIPGVIAALQRQWDAVGDLTLEDKDEKSTIGCTTEHKESVRQRRFPWGM